MPRQTVVVSAPYLPAARAIPTLQKMGFRVAVVAPQKHDPENGLQGDAESPWAQTADEILELERFDMIEQPEQIVRIASGANAAMIHAMWGPNSENPELVRACEEAGIQFAGSSRQIMEVAGHKPATREIARKAGVPILVGTEKLTSFSVSADVLKTLGFPARPLMIKGTDTGGGRMIYPVRTPAELQKYMRQFQDTLEAIGACPDSSVFLEQMAENPQHIEVQGVMDKNGDIAILGLRMCSLQEKRVKRIEEGPPRLSQLSREKQGEIEGYAERILHYLARHVGFGCVLTMEFLVDCRGDVYFLEINPRIQVEHRVTEFGYYDLDIVALSVLLSLGYSLKETLPRHKKKGHAIEARVYISFKELQQWIPSVNFPCMPGVLVDSAAPGYVALRMTPHIANVVAEGVTPEDAIRRLTDYLDEVGIGGTDKSGLPVETNLWALRAWVRDPRFVAGTYTTGFVEEFSPQTMSDLEQELRGQLVTKFWQQGRVDISGGDARYGAEIMG